MAANPLAENLLPSIADQNAEARTPDDHPDRKSQKDKAEDGTMESRNSRKLHRFPPSNLFVAYPEQISAPQTSGIHLRPLHRRCGSRRSTSRGTLYRPNLHLDRIFEIV